MVAGLEHVDPAGRRARDRRCGRAAAEQHPRAPRVEPEDRRVVVEALELVVRPRPQKVQREARALGDPLARGGGLQLQALLLHGHEEVVVGVGRGVDARRPDLPHLEGLEHQREPSDVVLMGVRGDHDVHAVVAEGADVGRHLGLGGARPRADEHAAPVGQLDERGVPLAHVDEVRPGRPLHARRGQRVSVVPLFRLVAHHDADLRSVDDPQGLQRRVEALRRPGHHAHRHRDDRHRTRDGAERGPQTHSQAVHIPPAPNQDQQKPRDRRHRGDDGADRPRTGEPVLAVFEQEPHGKRDDDAHDSQERRHRGGDARPRKPRESRARLRRTPGHGRPDARVDAAGTRQESLPRRGRPRGHRASRLVFCVRVLLFNGWAKSPTR